MSFSPAPTQTPSRRRPAAFEGAGAIPHVSELSDALAATLGLERAHVAECARTLQETGLLPAANAKGDARNVATEQAVHLALSLAADAPAVAAETARGYAEMSVAFVCLIEIHDFGNVTTTHEVDEIFPNRGFDTLLEALTMAISSYRSLREADSIRFVPADIILVDCPDGKSATFVGDVYDALGKLSQQLSLHFTPSHLAEDHVSAIQSRTLRKTVLIPATTLPALARLLVRDDGDGAGRDRKNRLRREKDKSRSSGP